MTNLKSRDSWHWLESLQTIELRPPSSTATTGILSCGSPPPPPPPPAQHQEGRLLGPRLLSIAVRGLLWGPLVEPRAGSLPQPALLRSTCSQLCLGTRTQERWWKRRLFPSTESHTITSGHHSLSSTRGFQCPTGWTPKGRPLSFVLSPAETASQLRRALAPPPQPPGHSNVPQTGKRESPTQTPCNNARNRGLNHPESPCERCADCVFALCHRDRHHREFDLFSEPNHW